MLVLTAVGTLGAIAVEPFVGVAVYYLFAVLRPQYMWLWALPPNVGWSSYVAWATMVAMLWSVVFVRPLNPTSSSSPQGLSAAHKAFLLFGAWICVTYFTALDRNVAYPWILEYLKLFVMFFVASHVLREMRHVWWVFRLSAGALIYIAYEINYLYLVDGRLDVYHSGYGGLDNNGAGLMLAMGVPLAIHAWEGTSKWWRWVYLAGVPLLLHAVLMTYSRGAMLSLACASPLLLMRSNKKKQFGLVLVLLLAAIPYLAGDEIRTRFFSVQEYESDGSATARFNSWQAARRIANDYPIFGVGIRNANTLSYQYGADMEGRTIHSQYFQTLADSGYPGLALYLLALGLTWLSIRQARALLKRRSPDHNAALARSMLSGVEGALFVFCFGATFLSLEVFELPYIIALIGVQVALLVRRSEAEAPVPAVAPASPPLAHAFGIRPHAS
jgi:probable O-glycosylation ligase (exosortase A-associated)